MASWDGLADALLAAPDRHKAAKEICDRCPVFDACSEWVAGLVPGEVSGVVAGDTYKPPTKTVVPKRRRRAA